MTNVRATARTYLRVLAVGAVLVGVLVAAFAVTAPAKAATDQSTWVAVDEYDLNPCTFSGVHMTGSLHILYHVNELGDGTLRIIDETNAQLTGIGVDLITGEPTGVTYIGASSYHDDFTVSAFPTSRTLTGNALMVSQGTGPNYMSFMLINETFDANGNLTAVKYTFTSKCVG